MNPIIFTQCVFLGLAIILGAIAIHKSPEFLINEEQAKTLNKPVSSAKDLKHEHNASILEIGFWVLIIGIALLVPFVR